MTTPILLPPLPVHTLEREEVYSGIAVNKVCTVLYYTADQMREYGAACAAAAVKHAYTAGWVACAEWAKRDDLLADIDSPAFQREFDAAIRKGTP